MSQFRASSDGVGSVDGEVSHRPRVRHAYMHLAAALVLATALGLIWFVSAGSRAVRNPISAGATDPVRPAAAPAFDAVPQLSYRQLSPDTAARYASSPWTLLGVTSGGSDLQIGFAAGVPGCSKVEGVYLSESAADVLIATLTSYPSSDTCSSALTLGRTTLHLAHPLGSRTLRHAAIDGRWTAVASSRPFAQ